VTTAPSAAITPARASAVRVREIRSEHTLPAGLVRAARPDMRSLLLVMFVIFPACQRGGRSQPASPPTATATIPEPMPAAPTPRLPSVEARGKLEQVATITGAMPTGIAVSRSGRIFINYPRWGDPVEFTVAELRNGKPVPYPDIATSGVSNAGDAAKRFVSVQSVVIDPADHLWVLDTGSVQFGPVQPGGAKLVEIDLTNDRIVRTIVFPPTVALPSSYLNDVRFDLTRGAGGYAYITDSTDKGSNAIIVVDLATETATRRLVDHPSVKAEPGFLAIVEGVPLFTHDEQTRVIQRPPRSIGMGADGIAISSDGATLYYCPLASRRLYGISTAALVDPAITDAQLGQQVRDLGEKGASDGMETDSQGRIYVTLYEQQAIARRSHDGVFETIVSDPRLLWPDTLSIGGDGYLYMTANQLHRQARFQGDDRRVAPYLVLRVKIDGSRIDERTQQTAGRP
jgi:sugar lactone lactonase YvrE